MALIKCDECGQRVSDKASVCPNCGAPIVRTIKCEECGTEFPEGTLTCPTCGCPIEQHATFSNTNQTNQTSTPSIQTLASVSSDMEKRVQRFLMTNRKYLPQIHFEEIRSWLLTLDDKKMSTVECFTFKDPTVMLLISFFIGEFGVDRFMLGDTKNGILKLILLFACGVGLVWWLIDLFKMNDMTQEYNYHELLNSSNYI